jgi:hypothetical protein
MQTTRIGVFFCQNYLTEPLIRSALVMTDTERKLIASAAAIGDSSCPVNG